LIFKALKQIFKSSNGQGRDTLRSLCWVITVYYNAAAVSEPEANEQLRQQI